jgi:glycosyltransferase involved in cell wall biosynthesis
MMLASTSSKGRKAVEIPPLSVVMPVHNALPHLDRAIESILDQAFSDFEFVILDDASTDGSSDRLRHWQAIDPRIRLLQVEKNLGPVGSSNMVARAARAPIVARMDADDISYPNRLAEEVRLIREHPDVGVVASLCEIIDSRGRLVRGPEPWRLARRSVFVPFAHGAMMYRDEVFERVGGYRDECEYWEDQDLIVRMAAISKVVVIPKPLYQVRQSTTSTRIVSSQERLERALDRVYRATDRMKEGKDYESLFDHHESSNRKLDPRVFIASGSLKLWAGERPKLLGRMLSRARLAWNLRCASAIIWTAWASASPSSLRRFMMFLLATRNHLAGRQATGDQPLQWRPLELAWPIDTEAGQ